MYVPAAKDWFRPRGYLHFDEKLFKHDRPRIEAYVRSPAEIAKHGFLPFIQYKKKKPKIEETDGKRHYVADFRPICYASHWDAHVYAYYSHELSKTYELWLSKNGLSTNVIAFRKLQDASGEPKCNVHLANDAFTEIRRMGNCTAYAFDIKSFFNSLDAKELKKQWREILGTRDLPPDHYNLFKSLTRYSIVDRDVAHKEFRVPHASKKQRALGLRRICAFDEFHNRVRAKGLIKPEEKGIPQGSPISAILANIYMASFDKNLSSKMQELGGVYFRYCDDILCIVPGEKIDIEGFISAELAKFKLRLNPKKTDISIFRVGPSGMECDKAIQYLGFMFDGRAISLRPASISLYRQSLRRAVNFAIAVKLNRDEALRSKGLPRQPVNLKRIVRRYSHTGKRTFISYGRRAEKIMKSETIRRQLARLDRHLQAELTRARSSNREIRF